MRKDCETYVKKYVSCQLYASVSHPPTQSMSPILSPCPFFQWGIDIVGPLPKTKGQLQYIVVAVDYMTKWVEAKPLARIREKEVIEFFMKFVVFRFGVPRTVVTDNGTQFISDKFETMLFDLKFKHLKAFVAYPQVNGQVEVTNRTILQGIKKRLQEVPRCWAEELPNVLWSYRTTPRTSTRESPFRMAYGTEFVLPMETSLTSPRVEMFDQDSSVGKYSSTMTYWKKFGIKHDLPSSVIKIRSPTTSTKRSLPNK